MIPDAKKKQGKNGEKQHAGLLYSMGCSKTVTQPKNSRILYNDLQSVLRCPASAPFFAVYRQKKEYKRGYKSRCNYICSVRIYLFFHTQVMRRIRASANALRKISDNIFCYVSDYQQERKGGREEESPVVIFFPSAPPSLRPVSQLLQKILPSHYAGR